MKKMKKIMCLLLVFVLAFGMSMTVFAEEGDNTSSAEGKKVDNTVSAEQVPGKEPDTSTHTYVAYKIFDGTQAKDEAELASIKWSDETADGTSALWGAIKSAVLKDEALKNDWSRYSDALTAQDVAEIVSEYGDNSAEAKAFARCVYAAVNSVGIERISITVGTTVMPAGYYLIVDVSGDGRADGTNSAYNLALLQLTNRGPFEIQNKTDVPKVEKKVQEVNDSKEESGNNPTDWQDAADYDIGDDVPFQLTGYLPSNYAEYGSYRYIFHDTLSAGLDFKEIVKVSIDGNQIIPDTQYRYSVDETGRQLTITFPNLKSNSSITATSKIVVEYKAILNDNAVIGPAGNPNDVYLEYSNNPNWRGKGAGGNTEEGDDDDDNDSDNDDDDDDEPTGKTPPDRVIVFTYEMDANKVDEAGNALSGAGFTLYKWVENKVENENDNEGESEVERVANGGYWKTIATIQGETTFEFKGIDAGLYKLEETTVPDGYNKADDIVFEVRATYTEDANDPSFGTLEVYKQDEVEDENGNIHYEDEKLAEGEVPTFTVIHERGIASTDVVNQSGISLPETGGIGTTIFYVVGGILVACCGVLLVTRKRVSK